jgi:hypothetical protein
VAGQRGDLRDASAHRAGTDRPDHRIPRQCTGHGALLAREARRALGEERGNALAEVGAETKLALQVTLEIELRVERRVAAA